MSRIFQATSLVGFGVLILIYLHVLVNFAWGIFDRCVEATHPARLLEKYGLTADKISSKPRERLLR